MRLRAASPTDHAQTIGMRHSHGLEQDLFGQRENRGIRADAEAQRNHCDRREAGVLAHHAQRVAAVGAQFVPKTKTERFPALFFVTLYTPELQSSPSQSLSTRRAPADEVASKTLYMELKLGVHFGLNAGPMRD